MPEVNRVYKYSVEKEGFPTSALKDQPFSDIIQFGRYMDFFKSVI